MARGGRVRSPRSLARRTTPCFSGDVMLIVCEGAKTEPSYFEGLKDAWKLQPLQVEIVGRECGSAPISVVDHAIALRDERRRDSKRARGRPEFDEVWCVFDRDRHVSLSQALDKARGNDIKVALSAPCFELWYLLHFTYTSRAFRSFDALSKVLRKYLPDYTKSETPLSVLLPRLDTAKGNAVKLREHNRDTGSSCPCADVGRLVIALEQIKGH